MNDPFSSCSFCSNCSHRCFREAFVISNTWPVSSGYLCVFGVSSHPALSGSYLTLLIFCPQSCCCTLAHIYLWPPSTHDEAQIPSSSPCMSASLLFLQASAHPVSFDTVFQTLTHLCLSSPSCLCICCPLGVFLPFHPIPLCWKS